MRNSGLSGLTRNILDNTIVFVRLKAPKLFQGHRHLILNEHKYHIPSLLSSSPLNPKPSPSPNPSITMTPSAITPIMIHYDAIFVQKIENSTIVLTWTDHLIPHLKPTLAPLPYHAKHTRYFMHIYITRFSLKQ